MATHDDDIVNSMRKRVIELRHGKVVRDEHAAQYTSMIPIVPAAGAAPAVVPVKTDDAEPQTRRQRAVSIAAAGDDSAAQDSMPPRLERRRERELPPGDEPKTGTPTFMNEDQL
jgi:cell division transport system ATP-binding protein